MLRLLLNFPLFVLIMLISAGAMLATALVAAAHGEFVEMRGFGYNAVLVAVFALLIGVAMVNRSPRITAKSHLLTLLLIYLLMPALLAIPVYASVPYLTQVQSYFEMAAALTTTGTFFSGGYHEALPRSILLWQAVVSWLGGLLTVVAAYAILEPLSLGGFEIRTIMLGQRSGSRMGLSSSEASERLVRVLSTVLPPYFFATLVLGALVAMSGSTPFDAAVLAMSTLSTSGVITSGSWDVSATFLGELFIAVFLILALSHNMLGAISKPRLLWSLRRDPEIEVAMVLLAAATGGLFLHHWLAAIDVDEGTNLAEALRAAWGAFFTSLSFLTTTGLESHFWDQARNWSGLDSPGIILLALAGAGGGVATTAGGVKLLRIYALYKHGARELQKLSHPNSVGTAGMEARRVRREGAYIAWMFFMLFVLGLGVVNVALALGGLEFETALALSVAAVANIGPAAHALVPDAIHFSEFSGYVQTILVLAMIFGRMEVLALIALMNPEYWRK